MDFWYKNVIYRREVREGRSFNPNDSRSCLNRGTALRCEHEGRLGSCARWSRRKARSSEDWMLGAPLYLTDVQVAVLKSNLSQRRFTDYLPKAPKTARR